ncbi:MAG: ATP-binding protein [Kiritimatiellaeota bacterium]|nr:ATP-binding protein [Kiritimatiellota bacterium]
MSDSLSQTIGNTLTSLPPLTTAVNRFLDQHTVPSEAIFRVNLAIEEIVTNIIKYGYDDTADHTITVNLALFPNTIHLQLKDDGHPFDPLQSPEPDIHLPLAKRKIGGLGLHLVRETANHIAYRRENGANILEMDIARQ